MRSRAVDASIVLILRQDVVHYAAAGNCGRFNHRSKTLLIKYGTKYGSTFVLKGTFESTFESTFVPSYSTEYNVVGGLSALYKCTFVLSYESTSVRLFVHVRLTYGTNEVRR